MTVIVHCIISIALASVMGPPAINTPDSRSVSEAHFAGWCAGLQKWGALKVQLMKYLLTSITYGTTVLMAPMICAPISLGGVFLAHFHPIRAN